MHKIFIRAETAAQTEDQMLKINLRRLLAALVCIVLLLGCGLAEGSVSQEEWDAAVQAESTADKDDWMNILLLGCDSYSKNTYSRSDSMIVLSVNAKAGQAKMTSLMRDTWIKTSGHNSRKLTELCAVGGPELTIQALNENFDLDIEKYMLISMEGIAEIIDLLGGLDLTITEAERKALNKGLFDLSGLSGMEQLKESGENVHLNGNQATAYARIRKIDSDYVRVERQRIVLLAMADKILAGTNAAQLLTVVNVLMDYVDTNLTLVEIMSLAKAALSMDLEGIQETRIPADGTYESGTFGDVWCIKPNFEKNKSILHDFIYG